MKNLKYLLALACVLAVVSCTKDPVETGGASVGDVGFSDDEGVIKGWIRIKLQDDSQPLQEGEFTRGAVESGNEELDRIAAMLGAEEVRRVFPYAGKFEERHRRYGLHLWYDVRFDEEVPVSRASSEFAKMSGIDIIEPIYKVYSTSDVTFVPSDVVYTPAVSVIPAAEEAPFNDPMLGDQWHYHNDGGKNGFVAGADINLFKAWEVEVGKPEVIVSIHDHGVNVNHEDLKDHMWINSGEIPGNGIDDDNNGFTDDINGWNFVTYSGTIDGEDHGSHVGGTISAVNNNGIGVCGVAGGGKTPGDGVRLMSTQIIQEPNTWATNDAASYTYAADMGAVISQNSWTLGKTGTLPYSYRTAFQYFIDNAGVDENGVQTGPMKGGIIIFATGNTGGKTLLPASSELVIGVTAMGPNYQKGTYANYGVDTDIMAPGGAGGSAAASLNVLSCAGDGGYYQAWGTSMACPHVSGVAALIVSKFGGEGFTADECKERLLNAYKPMGGLITDDEILNNIGVGLVDAAAAVMDDPKTAPAEVSDVKTASDRNRMLLTWKVPADANGLAVARYYITVVPQSASASEGEEPVVIENLYDVGDEVTYGLDGDFKTTYDVTVKTEDRYGNMSAGTTFKASTGSYTNVAPVVSQEIGDMTFAGTGTGHQKDIDLSEYITDDNIRNGDKLTFTVSSSNEQIVTVAVGEDGKTLTVTPMSKGYSTITVVATDLDGESVSTSFRATVTAGGSGGAISSVRIASANPVGDELTFEMLNVKNTEVSVTIYDSAARKVIGTSVAVNEAGRGSVNVSSIIPGMYTLVANGSSATFVKK